MSFSPVFLSVANFDLAFTRVIRSTNRQYKNFFSHLYPTFQASLTYNLQDIADDIRRHKYEPAIPTVVYFPKRSGVLRPISLLSLKDQIVYQAIVNIIANAFRQIQQRFALSKSFGAVLTASNSPFFYRSWKTCYSIYNRAMAKAFRSGQQFVGDFDLVSFYELIDHYHLRTQLETRIKNPDLLDLLLRCLQVWSTRNARASFHHGIPQGPDASAFLAECFLFSFDALTFRNVTYLRYIDDIRIMSVDEKGARRALLKLDLAAKNVGLVPQAQKIDLRHVRRLQELQKTVPSALLSTGTTPKAIRRRQKPLLKMFRESIHKHGAHWAVDDVTKFKFALPRLNRRRDVLRRISVLLVTRPDLSWTLSVYFKKFPHDKEAAEFLLAALKRDPTYDASAADYIEAMHTCEPVRKFAAYRRVIQTAERRSEEKSALLAISAVYFRAHRSGPTAALHLIARQSSAIVHGILLYRLFTGPFAAYQPTICRQFLETNAKALDEDLARFCGWHLFAGGFASKGWKPDKHCHRAVQLLAIGLGVRARRPRKPGVLEHFAREQGVNGAIPWKKALGRDFQQGEVLCINLRGYLIGAPDPKVLALDSLNDLLVQCFSKRHPALALAFAKMAGKKSNPDFGAWLNGPALAGVLPNTIVWLKEVHQSRGTPLAHPRHSTGVKKGKPTRSVSFQKAQRLMDGLPAAWTELLREWRKVL